MPESPSDPENTENTPTDAPQDDEASATTDLDEVLRRRVPPRVRLVQAGVLLLLLAVVAALLLRNNVIAPATAQTTTATATPFRLGPVAVLSNISSGVVTLNGKQLSGTPPLLTTFKRGVNTLTISASPFASQTCTITWPNEQIGFGGPIGPVGTNNNNCSAEPGSELPLRLAGQQVSPALIVTITFTGNDLSVAAQTQAHAAANAALLHVAPQIAVPVGDYISTIRERDGAVVTQPTNAPVQATLIADATFLSYHGDIFINSAPTYANGHRIQWRMAALVEMRWEFTLPSGETALSPSWSGYTSVELAMTYDSQSGWGVDLDATRQSSGSSLTDGVVLEACQGALDTLETLAQQQNDRIDAIHNGGLQGCVYDLRTPQGTVDGYFIMRFGTLLAADPQAHALLPSIPVAPPSLLISLGQQQ